MADPEKFPTMDSLTFATPEDAKKAETIFNTMSEQIAALYKLVEKLQWASCDGCGQFDYCPFCKRSRFEIPRKHADDCPITAVLRSS